MPTIIRGSGSADFHTALPVAEGGTGATASTGSGNVVLSASPTLTTPALGTPASGTLTNCSFPTLNQNTSGTAAGLSATLAVGSGGTGVTSSTGSGSTVLSASPTLTGTVTTNGASFSYLNVLAQNADAEGGEISLKGAASHPAVQLDNYSGNMRIHTLASGKAFNVIGGNGITANGLALTTPLPAASGGTGNTSGGGKVLQVLQAVKSDAFSTTSTSLVDVSGLSVTITPVSTSSKILVTVDLFISSSHFVSHAQLLRGTTQLYKGNTAGNRPRDTISFSQNDSGDGIMQRSSATYLDSPSTTSATTYKIQASQRKDGGHTCYINRTEQDRNSTGYDPRGASSITVMEIAG
jgi:hypothetical protein